MSVLSRATAAPSPAQLGALLDSADEALALVDSRLRLAYCNPAAMRLFGCAPAQGLDRAFTRIPEPLRAELHAALSGAATAWRREGRLADGTAVQLHVSGGPGAMRILRGRTAEASRRLAEVGSASSFGAEHELGRW